MQKLINISLLTFFELVADPLGAHHKKPEGKEDFTTYLFEIMLNE